MSESPDSRSEESRDPQSEDAKVKEVQTEEPKAPFGDEEPNPDAVGGDEGASE